MTTPCSPPSLALTAGHQDADLTTPRLSLPPRPAPCSFAELHDPGQLRADPPADQEAPVASMAVEAIANCRLPQFWRANPDLWFVQVEAVFQLHRVFSDGTLYNMVLAMLDPETIQEVSDVIRAPPTHNRYSKLKAAIVTRLSDSADR